KVRQPLAEAAFAVSGSDEATVLSRYADLLEDELNVKHIRRLSAAGEAAAYMLNPLPKQLGQKYGSKFPALRQAILAMDPEPAAKAFLDEKPVALTVNGETFEILPEEVEVRVQAREGFAVASDGAYLAALVTTLTPELVKEGLAREFVRRVQDLRKSADLDIADRITLYVQATSGLMQAVESFKDYIMAETLATSIVFGKVPDDLPVVSDLFDSEEVTVALKKA
ncbi:MAG: isoleucine--tRNA ligase, partial [Anaerolineaceae bacterium]|nr:isoleucine--tRNA ligase [Anaerolineaceae bacterium]